MDLRKIDALVAEKVMGININAGISHSIMVLAKAVKSKDEPRLLGVPHYSSDISAAWEVVDKAGMNWMNRGEYGWEVVFGHGRAIDESAPLAICLAALKSVGVEV